MRRPPITRGTILALEKAALPRLKADMAEASADDRAELLRAIEFIEGLIAHKRFTDPKLAATG